MTDRTREKNEESAAEVWLAVQQSAKLIIPFGPMGFMERGSELGEGLRSRSGSFSAAVTYDGTDVDGGALVLGIGVGQGLQWVGFSAKDGVKVAGGSRQREQFLTEGVRAPVTAT